MTDISQRMAGLSPERRAFLERQLAARRGETAARRTILPREQQGPARVSFAQQRLLFLYQFDEGSAAYNVPSVLSLSGPLVLSALESALNALVHRHSVLSARFPTVGDEVVQITDPNITVPLPLIDLCVLSEEECEAVAARLVEEECSRPFDLVQGPVLRAKLLRLEEEEHRLVVVMHHIVTDGWSQGLFFQELGTLYAACCQDTPSPLAPLPIQYADYADWQRTWLQGQALEEKLAYWKQQLTGAPTLLELPTDRPRPSVLTFRGARYEQTTTPDLLQSLLALSQKEGATLFMTLLTAFNALLHRYTHQDDILVGTPIANRSHSELEGLIGLFINSLVLRSNVSDDPTFRDALRRARQDALDAYAHQDLPFEKLVEELQPERSLSHTPLFQVMFALQNSPRPVAEFAGLTMRRSSGQAESAQFDLMLSCSETAEGLRCVWQFSTDLFEKATIHRIADQFEVLLRGIVSEPECRISRLPLLTEAERHQLLVQWNDTQVDLSEPLCLHQRIEQQAKRTPDAIALRFEGDELTYRQLEARANQLAHRLQRSDIAPEQRVGLCAERSLEMVIGLLGILKAGAAYVPLDPAYPQERIEHMIADTGMRLILTQKALLPALPTSFKGEILCLDAENLDAYPAECPASSVTPDNLAYVIYTSGSTGKPKGAMNTHRGICNRLLWMQETYQLGSSDRVLQKTPYSFDVSVWEFFWPLMTGATLVVASPELHKDAAGLVALIQAEEITTLHFVPSMLQVFIEEGEVSACGSLQRVICSGEALPAALVERFFARLSCGLHNLYGPTEAAVDVTYWECPRGETLRSVPIGRPVWNTRLYVLDPQMCAVPVGVSGELYLGGVQVGRGYLQRGSLTAEKFVPDPFGAEGGSRLYRTGDLVKYLPDGNIEYLGRLDHQVKIRGHRIELGEIESVLLEHPGVKEALVMAREDNPGDKKIVAYLVAVEPNRVEWTIVRNFLKERLPEYMVPAACVWLEEMPLSSNGKADRKRLPAPEIGRRLPGKSYQAPRTPTEEALATIWAAVLRLERVGIDDNFFELGGDSILSIQIVARAGRQGIKLTVRQLFHHQTVAALAAVAGTVGSFQAEQGVVAGDVPLTPIQAWFFERRLAQPHHHNQAWMLALRRAVDPAHVQAAAETLVRHHDALRLRFEPTDSGWRQVIAPSEQNSPFSYVDLREVAEGDRLNTIKAHAARLQASLDLTQGPLLRVAYFDCGVEQPAFLLLTVHHLAVDGVSWRILLDDLAELLTADPGAAHPLPAKTTSFQEWSQRLQQYAKTETIANQADYWLEACSEPVPGLPTDYTGGDNTVESTGIVTVALTEQESRSLLQEIPAVYHTRIDDVLLTALAQVLSQWTGEERLRIDLEGHGRQHDFEDIDISRTVGWFTALYPALLRIKSAAGPGEALKSVKEQLRRIPGQGVGYGLLRYAAEADADVSEALTASASSEVMFNYLGQFASTINDAAPFTVVRESAGPTVSGCQQRSHILEILSAVRSDTFEFQWRYSTQVHSRETIERLASEYVAALRALIAHCLSPEAGGFTPSDFPKAKIDQKRLDRIANSIRSKRS